MPGFNNYCKHVIITVNLIVPQLDHQFFPSYWIIFPHSCSLTHPSEVFISPNSTETIPTTSILPSPVENFQFFLLDLLTLPANDYSCLLKMLSSLASGIYYMLLFSSSVSFAGCISSSWPLKVIVLPWLVLPLVICLCHSLRGLTLFLGLNLYGGDSQNFLILASPLGFSLIFPIAFVIAVQVVQEAFKFKISKSQLFSCFLPYLNKCNCHHPDWADQNSQSDSSLTSCTGIPPSFFSFAFRIYH